MSRLTAHPAHLTNAARIRAAARPAAEALEGRALLSGSAPQAQPAVWDVEHDTLAVYFDFTDADPSDDHTATVNWNDGSPLETLLLDEPGTYPARPTIGTAYGLHAYAEPGARTVTLTLRDAAGHTTTQQFTALVGQAADAPFVGPSALDYGASMDSGGDSLAGDGDIWTGTATTVGPADLRLFGVNTAEYALDPAGFAYDPAT